MLPPVYAIVLNHNGKAWLERCFQSLLACCYPQLRVVLVDNGSTDGSVALARSISPQIHVLETGANLGFCGGNNAGIRYALERGAAYVALLNNDTYFESEWLLRLVEVGEANPQVGILGPVHLVFDGQEFNNWMTSAFPQLLDVLRRRDQPGVWLPVERVEGSGLVAKRKVFEQVGWLDPIFFAFFEEFDLCRRTRAAGLDVAIVPSSKIHHHRGGSFGQPGLNRRRAFLMMQSSMIYNSTDPESSMLRNVANLLRNDATHLKQAVVGNGSLVAWLRANCSMLPRLPRLYRKWRADRETIMKRRGSPG